MDVRLTPGGPGLQRPTAANGPPREPESLESESSRVRAERRYLFASPSKPVPPHTCGREGSEEASISSPIARLVCGLCEWKEWNSNGRIVLTGRLRLLTCADGLFDCWNRMYRQGSTWTTQVVTEIDRPDAERA
jgi:hypothetical protein